FSPDLKKLAFVRDKLDEMESVLILANPDGSSPRALASRPLWNGFSTSGVSWSPDGGRIAVTIMDREDREGPMKLATVDADTGEVSVLSGNDWLWIGKTAWLDDGSGIVVVAYGAKSPNLTDEVWFVSYPDGAARAVTRGLSGITGFGITRAGDTMIAGKNNRLTTRSYLDIENPDVSRVIAKSVSEDSLMPLGARWVGEDRIVYAKTQNGNADIWMMNLAGSENVQLTSEPTADYDPVVSQDGKRIVFRSNRNGRLTLWEMKMDGSNQREIVDSYYSSRASFPKDASKMYFSAVPLTEKFQVLFERDNDTGRIAQLTDFRSFRPAVSPDGKYILCFAVENGDTKFAPATPLRLTLFSVAEKKIVRQFERVPRRELPIIEWKHDNSGFFYVKKKRKTTYLDERGLDGETVKTIKRWEEGNVFQIALSEDGKRLFFEKGEDVVSVLKFENAGGV
ncbi:MAG: hypothetical protein OEM82_12610, partial [Acidobacteriota bacterium]|nr:hypothetical protein [Acidobacteriota bacterium]